MTNTQPTHESTKMNLTETVLMAKANNEILTYLAADEAEFEAELAAAYLAADIPAIRKLISVRYRG